MISFHIMKRFPFFIFAALLPVLQGCDTLRSTFGLDHYQPDAFNVPTNPPLTLPPDYNLRPPVQGAQSPHTQTASTQAQNALNVDQAKSYTGAQSERRLVHQIKGEGSTPENIRELLDQEAEEENTLSGKIQKQLDTWKKEAKKNLGSINDISGTNASPKATGTTTTK